MKYKKLPAISQSLTIATAIALLTASAHSATIATVGVYDENVVNANTVDRVAGGSDLTLATTTTRAAAAYANDTGGVWNFDTSTTGTFDTASRTSFDLAYGVSQTNTLNLSLAGNGLKYFSGSTYTSISGDAVANIGSAADITFTPSEYLTMLAVTQTVRSGAPTNRNFSLEVTLLDNTTKTTTVTNSFDGVESLHVLTATAANPIKSFKFNVNGQFTGFDDLAFQVVPEPSVALLGALGFIALLRRRRA